MLRIRIQHEPQNFAGSESDLTVEECTNKKGQNNLIGSIGMCLLIFHRKVDSLKEQRQRLYLNLFENSSAFVNLDSHNTICFLK